MDIVGMLEGIGADVDGWDIDWDVCVCPCGYTIEHDGRCPAGCVSPLLAYGLI